MLDEREIGVRFLARKKKYLFVFHSVQTVFGAHITPIQ
jgi:hypothetical protein